MGMDKNSGFEPARMRKKHLFPKLIFSQMDDIQLAKICRVSRAWNQLIQTTPALKNRLVRMKCLKAAKAVKVEEDSIFPLYGLKGDSMTFKKITMRFFIATIDPRHDFAPTLKAIKNGDSFYSSDEPIFSKLVLCQCRSDLAAAKETAEKLQKKFPRLLLTVVEFESKSDLAGAQATAEHIRDLAVQSEAFLVLQNPTRAKEIAERIENETQKIDALLKIAKSDPNMDLDAITFEVYPAFGARILNLDKGFSVNGLEPFKTTFPILDKDI